MNGQDGDDTPTSAIRGEDRCLTHEDMGLDEDEGEATAAMSIATWGSRRRRQ